MEIGREKRQNRFLLWCQQKLRVATDRESVSQRSLQLESQRRLRFDRQHRSGHIQCYIVIYEQHIVYLLHGIVQSALWLGKVL